MGTGMATRLPARFSRIPMTYRSGWMAALDADGWPDLGGPVEVVNIHLANPIGWPWWRSVTMRHRQVAQLLTHLAGRTDRQVVVGDINATPAWPAYRRIAHVLDDAAGVTATAVPTWRPKGRGPLLLRIDHVFVSGLVPIRTTTVGVPGADHVALVAELSTR